MYKVNTELCIRLKWKHHQFNGYASLTVHFNQFIFLHGDLQYTKDTPIYINLHIFQCE